MMLALNKSVFFRCRSFQCSLRYLSSQSLVDQEEYNETAIYPEIQDLSIKSRKKRQDQEWFEQIKNVKTIEEKLIKVNMPRYYGYKTVMLSDSQYPYNCLPLTQHYTRTLLKISDNLPHVPTVDSTSIDSLVTAIKGDIEDSLIHSNEFYNTKYKSRSDLSPSERDEIFGQIVVEQLNRSLINSLNADYDHLANVEIDLNPRHEAFWLVGNINPPKNVRKSKEGRDWQKDDANDPVNRFVQYKGQPYLCLRHHHPLNSFQTNTTGNVSNIPTFKYDARALGYSTDYCHLVSVPGHWPGSPNEFGLISYQKRDHMVTRNPSFGIEDFHEALHAKGIQSSFAWTLAQSHYQGFTTFNDITYPFNTQTIITNGKYWSFYRYQLNTTLIHSDHAENNPKANYCWGTKEMKLFDEFDANGKVVGFNDDIVKNLVNFYINCPSKLEIDTKPYLGKTEQKIADINEEERREFLERVYKHVTANRPRHLELPEIYQWEKIYKIDNKTRPMEAKRRFFELKINPWKRTLDQHTPVYIPRGLRPEGPKSKKKWKKTYYP